MRGHGEGQPHVHPARIALHRRVDELLDPREVDDLVELPAHLLAAHAQDRPVQVDVLPARQLRVEAGADLQQAGDPALDLDHARGRGGDPREDLQQRALAGAVPADDAQDLALLDLEADVFERPDGLALAVGLVFLADPEQRVGLLAQLRPGAGKSSRRVLLPIWPRR